MPELTANHLQPSPADWEATYRQSERRFRLLVDGATNFAMFLINPDGIIAGWNAGARRILGYEEAEVMGQHASLIFTPEDRANGVPEQELSTALREGRADDIRWHLRKDGTRFWADGIMESLKSESGEHEGYAKIFRDATQEKLSEERQRARITEIIEQAPAFMAVLRGPQHVFEMTNPRYDQMIGYREVLGKSVAEAMPEIAAQGFVALLDQVYATGNPYVATAMSISLQVGAVGPPSEVVVDFTYQPLFEQEVVSGVLVHGVDRTAWKQQERELRTAADALTTIEERFRLATASAQIGTWDYDILRDELFADANCRAVFGFPLDGSIKFATFIDQIHPDDRQEALNGVATVFSVHGSGDYWAEYRVTGFLDGLERWIHVEGKAFFDAERTQAVRFLGITRDITQSKRVEQDLEAVRARSEGALIAGEIATVYVDLTEDRVWGDANFARLFALSAEEVAGGSVGTVLNAIYDEDRARSTQYLTDVLAGDGNGYEDEYRVLLEGDAAPRWLLSRARVKRDESGVPLSISGVVVDITERKVQQEALRDQGEFLRRVVESSPDCIKTLDLDGRLLTMNEGGQAVMQVDDFGAVCGMAWPEFWRDAGTRAELDVALRAVREGKRGHFQGFCPTFKGEPRWWDVVVVPLFDGEGKPEQALAVSRDITFQHKAEERQRFLSDLTERARRLADPDAVIEETLRSVGAFLGLSRYIYAEVDDAAETLRVRHDWVEPQQGAVSVKGEWTFADWVRAVTPMGVTLTELRGGQVGVIRDFADDPRTSGAFMGMPSGEQDTRMRAAVRVPLYRDGKWVALLSAQSLTPRNWTAEDIALLETMAERTWLTLENLRLFRESQALALAQQIRAEHDSTLLNISEAVRDTLEPEAILQTVVSTLGAGLRADRCYFVRTNQTRDTSRVSPEWMRDGTDFPPLTGRTFQMSAYVVNRRTDYTAGRTHIIDDVTAFSPDDAAPLLALNIRSLLRVPIEVGDQMTALTVAMADEPRHWLPEEVRLVENVATLLRSVLASVLVQQRERNIAQQLQDALQPPVPDSLPGLALASYYRPALAEASVGGDFFDVYPVGEGCTALVVADLSGKGLAAASQVATVRNMLRFALYSHPTVAEAVTALHRALETNNLLTGFATLFVGVYDVDNTLTYVNGGQEPGLIWRKETGMVDMLTPTGPVLGGFGEGNYEQNVVPLFSGDVIALFTDGLTEVGPSRKMQLEIEGVRDVFRDCCASEGQETTHPWSVVECLIAGVDAFARGGVRDDISLLVGVVGMPSEDKN